MATATKMWSKAGLREDSEGNRSWTDGYHIIDAATKQDAFLASGLPRRNDLDPASTAHRVRSIAVANKDGPTQWIATVEYGVPPSGQWQTPTEDPLLKPFKWRSDPSYIERANEMDAKRRLKKNSAGIIFPPRPSRYRRRILVGTRYERFWNLEKSRKFENKTNLNPISLGPVVIAPYECLCHAIEPAAEFESDADYLLMQYVLEVAVDERATEPARPTDPPISGYPFEHHQTDISNYGWYFADGKNKVGRFCYASGTTASSSGNYVIADANDVQLDGTGKPKIRTNEQQIYVRSDDGRLIYEALSNPNRDEWLVGGTYATGKAPTESPYSTVANRMWLFLDHVAISFEDMFTLT